jgi:hypothetical protein
MMIDYWSSHCQRHLAMGWDAPAPEWARDLLSTRLLVLDTTINIIAKIDEQLQFVDHPSLSTQQQLSHQDSHQDPDAMDLDIVEQKHVGMYAPFGSKERAQRLEKNLCFKCGKPGHISPDCKKLYRQNSSVVMGWNPWVA